MKKNLAFHFRGSWRTTTFGFICFGMAAHEIWYNIKREAWPIHYWAVPVALLACGLIGWHARDHKLKDS
jgi:hypothetical protein